jgi:hypothetical protein
MSNFATANEPSLRQDCLKEPAVVDEATNPGARGFIALSTINKLADNQSRKRIINRWQSLGKTLQPWPIVRTLLAALLIVTGVLKATHSAELLASGGLLGSPAAIALVVGFEWFAATFIAIGPAWLAQRFAFVLFSGFAVVAAWAWWTDQNCGCFGTQTPQGVPLLFDIVALLLIAWTAWHQRRSGNVAKPASGSVRVALLIGWALAALGCGFTAWQIHRQSAAQTMPSWFGENLIGKEFPLLADPRFAALVPERGDAIIVMLRPNCEHCRKLVEQWPEISSQLPPTTKVIGISVLPGRWTVMPGQVSIVASETTGQFLIRWIANEPFIASPSTLLLIDRKVRKVTAEDEPATLARIE